MKTKQSNIKISDLVVVPKYNYSRNGVVFPDGIDGEHVSLAQDLTRGYDLVQGGRVYVTAVENVATEEEVQEALATQRDMYDRGEALKVEEQSIKPMELLSAFDNTYKGKSPKYVVVAGCRRITALILTNALLADAGKEQIEEVPCEVVTDAEIDELIRVSVAENRKGQGFTPPSKAAFLAAAIRLYRDHGYGEARLTDAMGVSKRGEKQKLFGAVRFSVAFPEIDLVGRLERGEVQWAQLNKEKTRQLAEGGDESAAAEWIADPSEGSRRPKSMSRKQIEDAKKWATDLKIENAVTEALEAILTNNYEGLLASIKAGN